MSMHSLLDIVRKSTDFLASKGVDNARFNAEVIIGHALGLKRMQLYVQFERLLSEVELEKIRPLVRRRSLREPLSYVLGEIEFHGLRIACDRRALIPRPETEELVEHVVKAQADKAAPLAILDLGTGTGCIAVALASQLSAATVVAVDRSEEALALASENIAALGLSSRVSLVRSDWYAALPADARFDLIVSNPPYLTAAETSEAMPEVREHEPHSALTARDEGLSDLRVIMAGALARLTPGGMLAMETGIAQHAVLTAELLTAGFTGVRSLPDLSGRDRFVLASRP